MVFQEWKHNVLKFNPPLVQLPTMMTQIATLQQPMSKYDKSSMRSSRQHAKRYTPISNCKTMSYTLYKQGKSHESTYHITCGIYICNFFTITRCLGTSDSTRCWKRLSRTHTKRRLGWSTNDGVTSDGLRTWN